MARNKIQAIAYLRTSSSTNVGTDKDSDKRQRASIEAFAKSNGYTSWPPCCRSKQRQTAHQQPIEGRIAYPFHPRCGETVLIQRRYSYRGVDLVVIPQPDGSVACIPEWMTHEPAAHFKLSTEPSFALEILRALRAEIDALLVFLPSDSKMERDGNGAQNQKSRILAAGTVRSRRAKRRAGIDTGEPAGDTSGGPAARNRRSPGNRGGRQ